MIRVHSIASRGSSQQLPISYRSPVQIRAAMHEFWKKFTAHHGEPEYGTDPLLYLEFMLAHGLLDGWSFEDLCVEYPEETDIIGICDMQQNMILLDTTLKNGHRLHRKRSFTIVHEIAHWVLHKPIYDALCQWEEQPQQTTIICRTHDIGISAHNEHSMIDDKIRMEWQANIGGATLLFPSKNVKRFAREYRAMLNEDREDFIEQCALLFYSSRQAAEIALYQHGYLSTLSQRGDAGH